MRKREREDKRDGGREELSEESVDALKLRGKEKKRGKRTESSNQLSNIRNIHNNSSRRGTCKTRD
jgi:hypothetical protein